MGMSVANPTLRSEWLARLWAISAPPFRFGPSFGSRSLRHGSFMPDPVAMSENPINPFAVPTTTPAPNTPYPVPGKGSRNPSKRYAFKSPRVLSIAVQAMMIAATVFAMATTAADLWGAWTIPGWIDDSFEFEDRHLPVIAALGLAALGFLFFFTTAVVLFCMWSYRVTANSHAMGAVGMDTSPGWAAGWWFVPFANLFKPFTMVKQNFQFAQSRLTPTNAAGRGADGGLSSEPGWKRRSISIMVPLWWGAWLLSGMLGQAEMRISDKLADFPVAYMGLAVANTIGTLASAILACVVVTKLSRMQQRWGGIETAVAAPAFR